MRRNIISNLQWWLFILLTAITWWLVPRLEGVAWWWLVLIGSAYYLAVVLIFRLSWETPRQAADRRMRRRAYRWARAQHRLFSKQLQRFEDEQRKADR